MPQPLYRAPNTGCVAYSNSPSDLTTFSPTTENSRRFSVTSLLELGDLHNGKVEDVDATESKQTKIIVVQRQRRKI